MSVIEKKILPEYFEKILNGSRTFELRLADWSCVEGDTLILKEYDKNNHVYTGREITKKVGYVLTTKDLKLFDPLEVEKHGYQVISLLPERKL
jgi:hypothetical protein